MENLTTLSNSFKSEMAIFHKLAKNYLDSDVELINQIANHIVNSGGKKLRPILMFYCKNLFSDISKEAEINVHKMAVAIEFIHTATLLHDDVVDESAMRRSQPTANSLFGNAASVLAGDFLYSRAFQIMTEVGSTEIMSIMANTTNKIAEGEVLQLMHCNNPEISEEEYLKVIYYKTAMLFKASCAIPAILSNQTSETIDTCKNFGGHIGTAFQLTDDLLDYSGTEKEIGKKLGDDLREGKATLPLIRLMSTGDKNTTNLLRGTILEPDGAPFDQIVCLIKGSDAIDYTKERALYECNSAKACLARFKENRAKKELMELISFIHKRKS
ncbi:polyprenyl synthetase family protein [Betaproteobacteria bacterium]|nr:polyprenyl synthetase family protein [Betaproteobacteria bacterium]